VCGVTVLIVAQIRLELYLIPLAPFS
jgi:hypothetical protein